ncbi:MAG: serine/threonine-protein phosphatase [Acidimicrobiia bacterium]|nr:serine/threonine-protein phosphatase [Acidimicrobiia bacterium]
MSKAAVSDTGRLLAVCDLLVESSARLDAAEVAKAGAEQLARLTRADLAVVAFDGPQGRIVKSYPRPVSSAVVEDLLDRAPGMNGERHLVGGTREEARLAGFGEGCAHTGAVAAIGSVDGAFSLLDDWLVSVVGRRIEAQLELVELHHRRLADAEILRDAAIAGEMQRALLPAWNIELAGSAVDGGLRPARHVGGDLYDLQQVEHDVVAIVADVSGKGAPASLLTAAVHSAFGHAVASLGAAPAAIIERIAGETQALLDRTGRILTAAVAATDVSSGIIRFASAGHHPVVHRSGGAARLIRPPAPPLGAGAFAMDEVVISMTPGDLLVLGSDGIVDQRRPDGTAFGIERLLGVVTGLPAAPGPSVAAIFASVHEFANGAPQDDDQTCVVMSASELSA